MKAAKKERNSSLQCTYNRTRINLLINTLVAGDLQTATLKSISISPVCKERLFAKLCKPAIF